MADAALSFMDKIELRRYVKPRRQRERVKKDADKWQDIK